MKSLILKLIPYKAKTLPIIFKLLRVTSLILPNNPDLLFAFGGRSDYWKNMGIELFNTEIYFRESIIKSDSIITELGWPSILPNFKNENISKDYFESESMVHLIISASQIAVLDYLYAKGIKPNAILGISLGEPIGVYAAGGISKINIYKRMKSIDIISSIGKKEFVSIYFNLSIDLVQKLSKEYDEIHPIYEMGSDKTLACVHQDKIKELKSKLSIKKIVFKSTGHKMVPYHSRLISRYKDDILKIKGYNSLESQPLKYDYFSTYVGGIIPKGTVLPRSFWIDLQLNPVLAHRTFKALKNTNKKFSIVQVGPDIGVEKKLQYELSTTSFTPQLFSTLIDNKDTIKTLKRTFSRIKRKGLKNNKKTNTKNNFSSFIQNFDLYNPYYIQNPVPFWNYLKINKSVLYIPKNNTWLVLGYNEIVSILNKPEHFSSSISNFFDKYLIGSDPPSHKKMRAMLQPMFSRNSLNRIEVFATKKTSSLIDNLPNNCTFNFVDYFSLPLSKSVTAYFLGLDERQLEKVSHIVGTKIYDVNDDLKVYFSDLLISDLNFDTSGALSYIRKLYLNDELSLDSASSIARLLWVAGVLTTSILLSNSFRQLVKHYHLVDELKDSDQLINKFIDECLRLDPPETTLSRITTQKTIIGKSTIPANSIVTMDLRAGNRDSTKFIEPEIIDLTRLSNSHLSFGSGPHVCLGMGLAKIEARVAIKLYLEVFKKHRATIKDSIVYYPSEHIRGPEKLMVKLAKNSV